MKTWALILSLALAYCPGAVPATAEPCARVKAMLEGDAAPCDGDLVPVTVLRKLDDDRVKLKAERKLRAIDAREWAAKVDARQKGWDACEAEPATVVERRGWSGWAVAGVVTLGVVLAALGGFAAGRAVD